ncbi:hypothetical protein K449DRAFT_420466 [Hypoxylon sp. EC38]|nr:hypothetical protein K449DRAFT_420466 [Hypoxylon sp. EC38]
MEDDTARARREGPLAIQLLKQPELINPQVRCAFSKLPGELREQIWRLSLRRYEDFNSLYNINDVWARPGHAAPLRVAVQLLLTCRAIYVETFLTPFLVNPIEVYEVDLTYTPRASPITRGQWDWAANELPFWVFNPQFHYTRPLGPYPRATLLTCNKQNLLSCSKLKTWQFANISSVEIIVDQARLEGYSLRNVAGIIGTLERHKGYKVVGNANMKAFSFLEPKDLQYDGLFSRKITHLTLRMNRANWSLWESGPEDYQTEPVRILQLEPMIQRILEYGLPLQESFPMARGYEARKAGREPDFKERQGGWGLQIGKYWPDLTTLELALETFACKKEQLDYVVQCAKLWTFPLEEGFHLCWDGKEEVVRWRGAYSYGYYECMFSRLHMDHPWYTERNTFRRTEAQDSTLIQWRPTTEDDAAVEAQEFVIHTLTFEKRRNTYRRSDRV